MIRDELELFGILSELNDDERAVVIGAALLCARRMAMGRKQYGPWCADTDRRDMDAEIQAETVDQMNYTMMRTIQRGRGGA